MKLIMEKLNISLHTTRRFMKCDTGVAACKTGFVMKYNTCRNSTFLYIKQDFPLNVTQKKLDVSLHKTRVFT